MAPTSTYIVGDARITHVTEHLIEIPAAKLFPDHQAELAAAGVHGNLALSIHILAGSTPAEAIGQAQTVLDFEKSLAASVMTIADKRDPDKVYHPMDLAALKSLAPNMDWRIIFREGGLPESTTVNVSEPEF